MRLIDLWRVTDGQKMFIKNDRLYTEVMDGPGYPVVDGKKARISKKTKNKIG